MIYHSNDLSKYSFLITGGAGFIGSNIVDYLMYNGAGLVRVLDDLSNGSYENISKYIGSNNFDFIKGDIRDYNTCLESVKGIDFISHQAALGSVPRSIKSPINTNSVNIDGFLNMMNAAKESKKLKRFVYAASSSTYGDSVELPKKEGNEGAPLSPYAVTKLVNELYAQVFYEVYGFKSIGLRYFNVFGPNQSFDNPYAAVIPIFCNCFLENKTPTIYGDGLTSRDFTYVLNAVQANIKSFFFDELNNHNVYNVAVGERTSLNEIIVLLNDITKKNIVANYGPERIGDVKHSLADISKIETDLKYNNLISFKTGLNKVYNWYKETKNQ